MRDRKTIISSAGASKLAEASGLDPEAVAAALAGADDNTPDLDEDDETPEPALPVQSRRAGTPRQDQAADPGLRQRAPAAAKADPPSDTIVMSTTGTVILESFDRQSSARKMLIRLLRGANVYSALCNGRVVVFTPSCILSTSDRDLIEKWASMSNEAMPE